MDFEDAAEFANRVTRLHFDDVRYETDLHVQLAKVNAAAAGARVRF